CYDELGCLETGGAFFDEIRRPFILTPHDRDMIKVQYLLYTRDRPEATMLCWNSSLETVRDSPFNASRPTKFIVHGYLDTVYFGEWMTEMKNAYLKNADMNVFIVDWSGGNGPGYETAVVNARIAGAEIAFLVRKLELSPVALDPAEPFFEGMPPEVRVDRSDADFVDVIHTDSHPYLSKLGVSEGMGMEEAVGHVDFYPNGGQIMP
ncbi:triacylglycerol lipase, putative, partial [Ixodes scapularis]